MNKLPSKFSTLATEWTQVKLQKNDLERREKALNAQLKAAIKEAHGKYGVNDPTSPVQVGHMALHLEQVHDSYGAVITKEQVGTRPLTRRGYEVLKSSPIAA